MPTLEAPTRDGKTIFSRAAAQFREGSVDEASRSFVSVLTTEAPAAVFDWESWRVIDEVLLAEGVEFRDYLPILQSHHRQTCDDVLGRWETPRREGDLWSARGIVSSAPDVENTWRRILDGSLRAVSIGYWPVDYVDVAPGQTARIAGRDFSATGDRTLRVTTRTMVFEASLVPVGADSDALIRALGSGRDPAAAAARGDSLPPRRRHLPPAPPAPTRRLYV
jgi:hypothetical protein